MPYFLFLENENHIAGQLLIFCLSIYHFSSLCTCELGLISNTPTPKSDNVACPYIYTMKRRRCVGGVVKRDRITIDSSMLSVSRLTYGMSTNPP